MEDVTFISSCLVNNQQHTKTVLVKYDLSYDIVLLHIELDVSPNVCQYIVEMDRAGSVDVNTGGF